MRISNYETEKIAHIDEKKIVYAENGEKTSSFVKCRDPFIMPSGGKYFLYRNEGAKGIFCLVSEDLEKWSEPVCVFEKPKNFHGKADFFWAPECHFYKGKYYIFTSVFSEKTGHRAISVYRADNPLGPFEDIAGGRISPEAWDAIDGTLYIDKDERPWMVFVHEWTCMPEGNGAMAAAMLSEDFTHFISEPIQLFLAKELPYAAAGVTDGPFLCRTDGGKLFMIWSNFSEKGYTVALSESLSGEITGPWEHKNEPVYTADMFEKKGYDGGHAMLFKRNDGQLMITFHSPNYKNDEVFEHVVIYEAEADGKGIRIKNERH